MELKEEVALVCGGLSGAGRAITAALLSKGWLVVAQDLAADATAAADTLTQETGAGDRLSVFAGEVATEDQREALVEFALEEFSRIDLLVCPALAGPAVAPGDLLELGPDAVGAALSAGAVTAMFLAQRVANEMIRLIESGVIDDGKIVFLGNLTAYTTGADQGLACLNAAAVAMLTRLFADRLGEYGINVYEVRTGLIATRRDEPGRARYDQLIRDGLTPIRRWGRPHDVALAVAAIADNAFIFSTGEVFNVDGGFHLRRL
jgi:3-oxoacyl-[acyl-carrier protein] reductase